MLAICGDYWVCYLFVLSWVHSTACSLSCFIIMASVCSRLAYTLAMLEKTSRMKVRRERLPLLLRLIDVAAVDLKDLQIDQPGILIRAMKQFHRWIGSPKFFELEVLIFRLKISVKELLRLTDEMNFGGVLSHEKAVILMHLVQIMGKHQSSLYYLSSKLFKIISRFMNSTPGFFCIS
jgi:hypothetical protein